MSTDHPFPWLKETVHSVGSYQRESREETDRSRTDRKGRVDLVTEVDRESERRLVKAVQNHFPEDGILAEENIQESTGNDREWIIDPLDGTTNYVQNHPFYGISVGLRENNQMTHATVYFPELEDFYHASRGSGAYKNGTRFSVSSTEEPMESFLATGFADLRSEDTDLRYNLEVFPDLLERVQGIRRGGSAVHDLSLLAEGVFDGFWEFNLGPWDVAAGALLVQEAGGRVTDMKGNDDWLHGQNIVASNGPLHEQLLEWIRNHLPAKFPQALRTDTGS